MNSQKVCVANDGIWVPFKDLYPDTDLSELDLKRFTCRILTHEEEKTCTDNRDCRGQCVAPDDAASGQEAVGTCSKFQNIVDSTLTVIGGKVSYPVVSMEMTADKIARLEELSRNRNKWNAHTIRDYSLVLEQSCFCLYGPYYGPNRVTVRAGEISRVVYLGERRDGFKPGDRLTNRKALKNTIVGLFDDLETRIQYMTGNAELQVEYDDVYGFPTVIDYDRPDWEDEQFRIEVSAFKPKR